MAITVVSATADTLLHFEVCPNATGTDCRCEKNEDGAPTEAHRVFDFTRKPEDDERSDDEWARSCAYEACLLVKSERLATVDVPAALGVSVE